MIELTEKIMARQAVKKPVLTKTKKKVVRKTHSETYLVNRKYYGDSEPNNPSSKIDMILALNWYHAMKDADDAKSYLKDYFKDDRSTIRMIDKIPERLIPYTSAWLCRIAMNKNTKLELDVYSKVVNDIEQASGFNDEPVVEKPKVDRPNIQDRIKERVSDIIGDVEQLLDDGLIVNFYEWLQKNEIPAAHAKKIAEYYLPIREELIEAIVGQLEGYEKYTKPQLKGRAGWMTMIINDCERYSGNVKKSRAPRKKKAPTTDKLLKYFKYLKESNEHKLASINPETIIGAQTLWAFNTSNNTLHVFNAVDRAGLSINRTAIGNYDPKTSKSMRIGRKTAERLKAVLTGGKIVLRKLQEEMNNEVSERINISTILLKTVR
jgi:hypothetical protein